ncbi:hypothetical protein [Pseudidiomarina aestuarii]
MSSNISRWQGVQMIYAVICFLPSLMDMEHANGALQKIGKYHD